MARVIVSLFYYTPISYIYIYVYVCVFSLRFNYGYVRRDHTTGERSFRSHIRRKPFEREIYWQL